MRTSIRWITSVRGAIARMSDIKEATFAAALDILVPLATLFLKAQIGAGECAQLCERAFILALERAHADEDRPTPNVSQIATRTGLTRKRVSQLRATGDLTVSSVLRGQSRISRVLWGWQNDVKFKDRAGNPRILPLRGARSFAELVKDYAAELRIKPVLTELMNLQIVRLHEDKSIELLRGEAGDQLDAAGTLELGRSMRDQLDALVYNLEHPAGGPGRFFRTIVNERMLPGEAIIQTRDAARQAQSLANTLAGPIQDPLVTVRPTNEPRKAVYVSVTLCVSQREVVVPARNAGRSMEASPQKRKPKG
jgi:Family of unknown function (DUF6502)